jgi:hypothetical protein
MKKTIAVIILAFSFFVFDAEKSLAMDWGIDLSGIAKAARDAADKAICQAAQPKILEKSRKFNNIAGDQFGHHEMMLSRLSTIVAGARANGYDVDRLESDRRILLSKYNTLHSNYMAAYNLLYPLSSYSCNNGTNQDLDHLKSRVSSARGYIDNAKDITKEMKSFYREVIRGDINILKNQQYQEVN